MGESWRPRQIDGENERDATRPVLGFQFPFLFFFFLPRVRGNTCLRVIAPMPMSGTSTEVVMEDDCTIMVAAMPTTMA